MAGQLDDTFTNKIDRFTNKIDRFTNKIDCFTDYDGDRETKSEIYLYDICIAFWLFRAQSNNKWHSDEEDGRVSSTLFASLGLRITLKLYFEKHRFLSKRISNLSKFYFESSTLKIEVKRSQR